MISDLGNLNIRDEQPSNEQLFIGDGKAIPVLTSGSSVLTSTTYPLCLKDILYAPKI